jgi:hypothetical protein
VDALDYVRYRHGDNDFFRAARQQDFLRQISHQDNVRQLLNFGKRKRLARIFGRYFEVDKSFLSASNIIGLLEMGVYLMNAHAPVNQVRFPALESRDPTVNTYLYFRRSALKRTLAEFMTGAASAKPAPTSTPTHADKQLRKLSKGRHKPSSIRGLERAGVEGENMAVLAETRGHLGFSFYYPTLRKTGSRYASTEPRLYTIRDEANKRHRAYRLVLYGGAYGEYYGVQGTAWRYPPILDNPDGVKRVGGRRLLLYYDGAHLRLVGWRTRKAVYWVTNTLDQALSNRQLIAIAASLRRIRH